MGEGAIAEVGEATGEFEGDFSSKVFTTSAPSLRSTLIIDISEEGKRR